MASASVLEIKEVEKLEPQTPQIEIQTEDVCADHVEPANELTSGGQQPGNFAQVDVQIHRDGGQVASGQGASVETCESSVFVFEAKDENEVEESLASGSHSNQPAHIQVKTVESLKVEQYFETVDSFISYVSTNLPAFLCPTIPNQMIEHEKMVELVKKAYRKSFSVIASEEKYNQRFQRKRLSNVIVVEASKYAEKYLTQLMINELGLNNDRLHKAEELLGIQEAVSRIVTANKNMVRTIILSMTLIFSGRKDCVRRVFNPKVLRIQANQGRVSALANDAVLASRPVPVPAVEAGHLWMIARFVQSLFTFREDSFYASRSFRVACAISFGLTALIIGVVVLFILYGMN